MADPAPDGKGPAATYQMLGVPSFWKGVELLGTLSGKKIALPDALSEWPDERSENNWQGLSLGAGKKSIREVFEQLCLTLDVVWRYDSAQNVIRLDPKWRRDDLRPGQELIGVVLNAKPVRWTDLPGGARNGVGGIDRTLDEWRLAFDALLSRPENFPSAGTLRLYHDTHGHVGLGPLPVTNLYAGKMRDGDGHQKIIILNGQESFFTKENAGELAYYLFDEQGKFIRGGVFSVGEKQQGFVNKAVAYDDRDLTVIFGVGRLASSLIYIHFVLDADGLVVRSSTDSAGKIRDADQTQTTFPEFPEGLIKQKFGVAVEDRHEEVRPASL